MIQGNLIAEEYHFQDAPEIPAGHRMSAGLAASSAISLHRRRPIEHISPQRSGRRRSPTG